MSDKPKDEQTPNSSNPPQDDATAKKVEEAPATDEKTQEIPVEQDGPSSEVVPVEEKEEPSATEIEPLAETKEPSAKDPEPTEASTEAPQPATPTSKETEPTTQIEISPKDKPAQVAPAAKTQSKSKAVWLLVILLILGWAGTGYGGYWLYQQQLQAQNADQQLAQQIDQAVANVKTQSERALQQQSAELDKARATMQQDIKAAGREAARDFTQLQAALKEHEERLNGQQQRLLGLTTTSREDWLLAEAEYLLKLANQRILLEQTPENVLALLQRADEIIEQASAGLGDRELFAIRKRLAEHITALKLIKPVDTQGTYLRLGALASSIGSLPTLPTQEERFSESSAEQTANTGWWSDFKTEFKKVLAFFEGAFRFRDEEELANPLVSQQHLQLMQLNTRLLIEQAQIALLKNDQTTYSEALNAAAELTEQYYFESPARKTFAAELRQASSQVITVQLPDISGALKLLHAYTESLHRLRPADTQASGG